MAQAPFVINPALTRIVNEYGNRRGRPYIADLVLPRIRVSSPEFKYTNFPIEEAFDVPDTQVDRKSKPNEIALTATEATGSVKDYGLDSPVPYRDERAQANGSIAFNLRARAARVVTDKVALAREIRASTLLFTAANYQTGYKATVSGTGATGQWSASDSKPVAMIRDAAAGMLVRPNTLVVGEEVLNQLVRNADVSVSLGGSAQSGRVVPNNELATVLGVSRIIVGNSLYQTSKKGQTHATARIWGKHAALLYIPEEFNEGAGGGEGLPDADGFADPVFAATFQWNDRVSGEIPDPDMGLYGGVRVRSGESLVEQIVAPYAGYLFTNAVA